PSERLRSQNASPIPPVPSWLVETEWLLNCLRGRRRSLRGIPSCGAQATEEVPPFFGHNGRDEATGSRTGLGELFSVSASRPRATRAEVSADSGPCPFPPWTKGSRANAAEA